MDLGLTYREPHAVALARGRLGSARATMAWLPGSPVTFRPRSPAAPVGSAPSVVACVPDSSSTSVP